MCGVNMDLMEDTCVLCDCDTGYDTYTSVKDRNNYVEGSGQLCETCWNKVYNNNKRG